MHEPTNMRHGRRESQDVRHLENIEDHAGLQTHFRIAVLGF